MFNIEKFYQSAITGDEFDYNGLLAHLRSFKRLVLRGAGNIGTEISAKLLELGIKIDCFWDKRAREIVSVNGLQVLESFTGDFDKDETLVIICITNGSLGDGWQIPELLNNGYNNYLYGIRLYEALICPFKKGDKLIPEICLNNSVCTMCNCKKYLDMIPQKDHNDGRYISLQVLTTILTRNCTLDCVHCGQLLSQYPEKVRRAYCNIDEMKTWFDRFMGGVDKIGMVSVIGGEPFLHPQLTDFVLHCLKTDNFGVLNITTNGICQISDETLEKLKHPRIKISFSDYTAQLSDSQTKLFHKNVERVKGAGINTGVGVAVWWLPSKIEYQGHTEENMTIRKSSCISCELHATIVDGYFAPCTIAEPSRGLNLIDINKIVGDYVDLTSNENLRDRIYTCINKPFYENCRYCSYEVDRIIIPAGEQRRGTALTKPLGLVQK